ncbi:ribose-5-phosphate isomerase rki1, partial [Coemansia furcata]
VDAELNAIKGGGGAHLREKLVAAASRKLVLIADYRKDSEVLGEKWDKGVPVEVSPLAWSTIKRQLERMVPKSRAQGLSTADAMVAFEFSYPIAVLRQAVRKAGPVVTDNGNFILDVSMGKIYDPLAVEQLIKMVPGVIEVGIFSNMATEAWFGNEDGSISCRFARSEMKKQDELGYEFDLTNGKLRNTSTGEPYKYSVFGSDKKKNADLYHSLLAPASRDVYRVLVESDLGMEPIAVPDARQPHCNIYVTPDGLSKKHLVVIITGHGVCGGVWAWNVLVKEGLRAGSVVEYVRGCVRRGYGVLVLNPNENIVAPDGFPETFNTYAGHSTPIHGSETPDEHVGYVWSRIIR